MSGQVPDDTLGLASGPVEGAERDGWGPARVLHHATEAAGIAPTGPIPPYVSRLTDAQVAQLAPVAAALREGDGA